MQHQFTYLNITTNKHETERFADRHKRQQKRKLPDRHKRQQEKKAAAPTKRGAE